jgi:ubiquitin-conjugating enzyme E2 S
MSDSETEDPSKENDPSLSSTPVHLTPPSPRKALGKRPLSVLTMPYPEDPDGDMMLIDSDSEPSLQMSSSEQNIFANIRSPPRKSPRLSPSKGNSLRLRDDLQIYEDVPDRTVQIARRFSGDGKENRATMKDLELQGKAASNTLSQSSALAVKTPLDSNPSRVSKKVVGGSRKLPAPKAKPRIGVRRL